MSSFSPSSLAADLLLYLERLDRRPFAVIGRAKRRAFIGRLREAGRETTATEVPADILKSTRRRWETDYRVHLPEDARMRLDTDGIWVSAWVLAGEGLGRPEPIDGARLAEALASMPLIAREVFVLHRRDGLSLREIGGGLGISLDEALAAMTEALLLLDVHIGPA